MNGAGENRTLRAGPSVAIVGGGPAGLMAAEVLSERGVRVTVYERMPSVGRKLLLAGRGGLNLTHSEGMATFLTRYGDARERLAPVIAALPPDALRAWSAGLGQPTFIGSSGRVFPVALKASPLLRAWIGRLRDRGVVLATRRTWRGWDREGRLLIDGREGQEHPPSDATVLALGGASWPRMGSVGDWVAPIRIAGVAVTSLRPANCGFSAAWSEGFRDRFAGVPLKKVVLRHAGRRVAGEALVTAYGIEGGAIYALSASLRDAIAATGAARLSIDLRPDLTEAELSRRLARIPSGQSNANRLRKGAALAPVAANLLREVVKGPLPGEPQALAALIKDTPLVLLAAQPIERAISTAGGVAFDAVDDRLMLRARPGTFVAGEMLDWEAPTGGYLLQAAIASGAAAARGVLAWLDQAEPGALGAIA